MSETHDLLRDTQTSFY